MRYGAYSACLHDRPLEDALQNLKDLGLNSIEINTGGFIPSPHCHVDLLLASEQARMDYLEQINSYGIKLTALNCNGNALSPMPQVGPKHADDLRRTVELAGKLGVKRVVAMSGLPGTDATAKYPTWVVNSWNSIDADILDYQWSVAVPFWQEIDELARRWDVKVALELHPQNLVFNTSTFRKLLDLTSATNLGVEMDTSHLMWQGMDVVEVIRELGEHIVFAAAKDIAFGDRGLKLNGVLDVDFTRVPADAENKTPTGYGTWCNSWPEDYAWRFVAVGKGHETGYWVEVLKALQDIDPDMVINIEHEDAKFGRLEGLSISAETLLSAAAQLS